MRGALPALAQSPTRSVGQLLRFGLLGLAIAAVVTTLPSRFVAASAVVCGLTLPLIGWLVLRAPREQARVLVPTVLAAVAARVVVASVIAVAAPADFFSMDQRRYEWLGYELAQFWAGLAPYPDLIYTKPGYYVWNALVYSAVGYVPLAVSFSNAAIAALSIVLVYRITLDLAGPRAARIAALFAAFFPSLVLWSSLNLKDAAAIATILLALRGAQRFHGGFAIDGLAKIALGLLLLSQLRDYLVVIVVLALGMGLLLPRLRSIHVPLALIACASIVWYVGAVPDPVEQLGENAAFEVLDQHRRNLAVGDSAYHADADISSARGALRFLPIGLSYFLLAPAPWQLWNARQWLTLPEMLVWYTLLPQVAFGLRELWRRRRAAALPLVCFGLFATLSYALVEANLGTAYRHRAQVLVIYLILAAIGLATRKAALPTATPEAAHA